MSTNTKQSNADKNKIPLPVIAVCILLGTIGLLIRLPGLEHISGDMIDCYLPWYESVPAHQGIGVLRNYPGDYSLPYATMLLLLHYIPGSAVIKIKVFSILFEYLASFAAGLLASCFFDGKKRYIAFVTAFSLTLFYPALVLNGAWWGQCDGVYAGFVLLSVYALLKDRPAYAFIFLGIAVTAKLQTIFITPFLILYYYRRRSFSLLYFLLVPVIVEILYIPAFFCRL